MISSLLSPIVFFLVIALLKAASNLHIFERLFARAFPTLRTIRRAASKRAV
jgi:hypothetical protein